MVSEFNCSSFLPRVVVKHQQRVNEHAVLILLNGDRVYVCVLVDGFSPDKDYITGVWVRWIKILRLQKLKVEIDRLFVVV